MLLRHGVTANVKVENTRVNVEGRVFEASHVIVVGAAKLEASIEPGKTRINASFSSLPSVEPHLGELVKIQASGSKYEVDVSGDTINSINKLEEGYEIDAGLLSIKFESDEAGDNMVVKIPKVGVLKAKRLVMKSKAETSMNIITTPFIIGVASFKGGVKARVLVKEGELLVEVDKR